MSRREDRERNIEGWLEHLQAWRASGEPLCTYARARGIKPSSMYHWRNVLRGAGRWPEDQDKERATRKGTATAPPARVPLRFARVKLDEGTRRSAVTVHVTLRNGRRTEIALGDAQDLGEVLAVLERPA